AQNYHPSPLLDIKFQTAFSDLAEKGIAKLSGCITTELLHALKQQFGEFPRKLDNKIAKGEGNKTHYDEEEHYWSENKAYVSNNAFRYSESLIEVACRQPLVTIAQNYFAKPVLVKRAIAMRYLPSSVMGNDMFTWHHDVEDKQMKVMILLTDVSDSDQYMSYIERSHIPYRPFENYSHNKLKPEDSTTPTNRFLATGIAGDMFLFDSNGLHSANRFNSAAIRDVFILEYGCDDSDIAGGAVRAAAMGRYPVDGTHPLSAMANTTPFWAIPITRKNHTWIENLPFPGTWISNKTTISEKPLSALKLIYVIQTDNIDPKWQVRLDKSIKSLRVQEGRRRVEICIADYSSKSILDSNPNFGGENQYFHQPLTGVFNRALCINHAYKRFITEEDDYFLSSDIDVVLPPDFIEAVSRRYIASKIEFCMTAPIHYFTMEASERITQYIDPSLNRNLFSHHYHGGCILYSRTLFEKLRGYDEAFEGWGGEDDDFYDRVRSSASMIIDRTMQFQHLAHDSREDKENLYRDENRDHLQRKRNDRSLPTNSGSKWGVIKSSSADFPRIPRHFKPCLKTPSSLQKNEQGYSVYLDTKALELNTSAALIYSNCAKGFSVGGIIDTLLGEGIMDEDTLTIDVMNAIKQFSELGLLRSEAD
ncbi:MAG: hypothetical protein HOM55_10405, partial [Proteobacteria bacterium]|nr:hypothetical protein [Pseudomonadota bacterium]